MRLHVARMAAVAVGTAAALLVAGQAASAAPAGGPGGSDQPPVRIDTTTIGSGFAQKTEPAALVVGPTGVGLRGRTLYLADTVDNRITAIPDAVDRNSSAGTGRTVTTDRNLNGPLGLAIAPNGNILTVNSGDGKIVETTPRGDQVAVRTLDTSGNPPGAGALFGLAVATCPDRVYFVDDATNTLNLLSHHR